MSLVDINNFIKGLSGQTECVLESDLDIIEGKLSFRLEVAVPLKYIKEGKVDFDKDKIFDELRDVKFPFVINMRTKKLHVQDQFDRWKLKRNLEDIDKPEVVV